MVHGQLAAIRERMQAHRVDFYLVPSTDPHRNEYVPACWQRRGFLSQFYGSAGDLLITSEMAYLWTDGRYFLEAESSLDPEHYQLMRLGIDANHYADWIADNAMGKRCAVDPRCISIQEAQRLEQALGEGELVPIEDNWVDAIWSEQPDFPRHAIQSHPLRYSGQSTAGKLVACRHDYAKMNVDAEVLTTLDSIAWVFNIRGTDIPFNPLCIAYAIITQTSAMVYVTTFEGEGLPILASEGVELYAYEDFPAACASLRGRVLMDPNTVSWWVRQQVVGADPVYAGSPITLRKAIKNSIECAGMANAHVKDAVAMVRFLHWLSTHWESGVTELSAAQQLSAFRLQDSDCVDLSFETISAFGAHGAIIHYSATEASDIAIDDRSLYLLDSGGQYRCGTTDITRTIHLGEPTPAQKEHYTLVLKGHLALSMARFPSGTTGDVLDALARKPLQDAGYEYAHGTGHGVGCYLCVHEGPQSISPRKTGVVLESGMMVSNEPGLYLNGHYGIRIENVCQIESLDTVGNLLYFRDLTLVPYAKNLMVDDLLTEEEKQQINAYHRRIYEVLGPFLDPGVLDWLSEATSDL